MHNYTIGPTNWDYKEVSVINSLRGDAVTRIVYRRTDGQTDIGVSHKLDWSRPVELTRAPRGTDRSPEYNEHFCYKLDIRVKNLTTEWNQKQHHFKTHASRSLLWIRCIAVAFRSDKKVFEEAPPPLPILLELDPPLGKYGQNIFMHVPGHKHFILTKFRKHPLSDSHGGCG